MNKKIFGIFVLLICIVACSEKVNLKDGGKKRTAPFGTKQVAENIYVNKALISNIDYKEYLYWINRIYGKDSAAYKNAIPDSTVWLSLPPKYRKYESSYFENPRYDERPVMGLSLAQATVYTAWRTDRVAEAILIQLGAVEMNISQKLDNHFTVERYLNKTYPWKGEHLPELILPVYSIPTDAEVKLYERQIKTNYLFKKSDIQMDDNHRLDFAKGFWNIARYQNFSAN